MTRFDLFIDGRFVAPASGRYFPTEDPYLGETWAEVADAGDEDVELAVDAAARAFRESWRRTSGGERARSMRRLGDLVLRDQEELARMEVRDNAKSIGEMRGQLRNTAEWYYYYGGLADKLDGRTIPADRPGLLNYTVREPLGVVVAVLPWNSPLRLAAWKVAPALAAGNTVIVKPSEFASASLLRFCELVREAGFPPGVFNVLTGGARMAARLTSHPLVARVAFTGGESSGKAVLRAAAETVKPVTLELGGKSANIVFADADLAAAAQGAVTAAFGSGGQSCTAGSRLLVEDRIHDAFLDRVRALAGRLRLSSPLDEDAEICPIGNKPQLRRILQHIENAAADGARLVLGGTVASGPTGAGGSYVLPTIFADVSPDMRIAQEEVFGPVLAVMRFRDEAEAVRIANSTRYGLAAGVWTESIARAHRVAALLEAGTVWINTYRLTSQASPYGGVKQSGFGREGGQQMIDEYLQTKSVWVNVGAPYESSFGTVAAAGLPQLDDEPNSRRHP